MEKIKILIFLAFYELVFGEKNILKNKVTQAGARTLDLQVNCRTLYQLTHPGTITYYQIVITDFKYFSRHAWQYMVLDEAQAIKSASSQRWKMLLEFKCRGRLLLSGTPVQLT